MMIKQTEGSHALIPPGSRSHPATIASQVDARQHFSCRARPSLFLRKSIGKRRPAKKTLRRSRQ
eukprot:6185202-Pleurochrysis_carterae.AAC.2